jgi:hypothetical protein
MFNQNNYKQYQLILIIVNCTKAYWQLIKEFLELLNYQLVTVPVLGF